MESPSNSPTRLAIPTPERQSDTTSITNDSTPVCMTPLSPGRKSRFCFHSDTKAPKEFSNLVDSSHARQTEYCSRLNDIDRRVAAWISRQTEELLDREIERSSLVHDAICDPLERSMERVMSCLDSKLNKFSSGDGGADFIELVSDEHSESSPNETPLSPTSGSKAISIISSEVSHLSQSIYDYMNITIPTHMKSLQTLRHSLVYKMPPKLTIEQAKVNKREGKLVRKFEAMAGVAAKSFVEENASRVAQLQILDSKVNNISETKDEKIKRFQTEIANIKMEIDMERAARIRQNEIILQKVIDARDHLQRLVLDSVGAGSQEEL